MRRRSFVVTTASRLVMDGFGDDDVQELRGLVMNTLEQQGALAKIRASLRAAVFCAIHEQGHPISAIN